ncbi:hypothetical protein RUM43_000971 [Polyplax serrata]|uniref:cAMP-dependent protein kinase inhibitor n=1 Tax=Polyplax serrata TaxID=468196 RepID=A0AAN8SD45_POLSC
MCLRKKKQQVMKMIAIMESNPEMIKDPVTEFLVTGRTGRRNAMADILGPNASVTSSDLPKRLESLTTMDGEQESSSMTHSKDFEQQETMPESKKTAETSDTLDKAKAEAKS